MTYQRARTRGGTRVVFAVVALVALLIVGSAAAFFVGRSELEAPSASHGAAVTIHVAAGETIDDLANDLASHGLIKSTFWFSLYARFKGLGSHLRTGDFLLDDGMGASAVIAKLESGGDISTARVTLTEGETLAQMAVTVHAALPSVTVAAYTTAASSAHGYTGSFLSSVPAGATLEGFLFPDTYDIPVNATARDVVQLQLNTFAAKAQPLLKSTTLTPYQTIIVASILERETEFSVDRPLVAGLILNRLNAGMPLQVDSTVSYGLGITATRQLTTAQLTKDTPYNTYIHSGLPPTPISNPGVATLTAAATPAHTDYIYFISDCSGHNHYSVTEADHEAQIAQYLDTTCGSTP